MMPSPKRIVSMTLFCLLMTFCVTWSVKADTVETYTGKPYTGIIDPSSGYTTSMFITATLTFANPLPADASLAYGAGGIGTPTATDPLEDFVMTDGQVTLNLSDAGAIDIFLVTGSGGQIVSWFVGICAAPCSTAINIDTHFGEPVGAGTQDITSLSQASTSVSAYNVNDPGTWSATTTSVPEPSSLALLGVGLLGLAVLTLKKSM